MNSNQVLTSSWLRSLGLLAAFSLLVSTRIAPAQQPTGGVSGFVSDATTHRPLRFAVVKLVPQTIEPERFTSVPSPGGIAGQLPVPRLQNVVGLSGIDGHFEFAGVPAGDYFVAAQMLGYIEPGMAVARKDDASAEEVKAALDAFPKVRVAAGQVETANLTLQRGGAIIGRMQYADGSPVIGMPVGADSAVPPPAKADLKPAPPRKETLQALTTSDRRQCDGIVSDDQGIFRLFGLPPGKYTVDILLGLDHSGAHVIMSNGPVEKKGVTNAFPELILIFAPGVFRQKEAKVYEIRGEETITDANLQIDFTGLHTLTGKVLVGEDRHAPRGSITLQVAGSQPAGRIAGIEEDGSFQFNDLPEDSYILQLGVSDTTEDSITHMFTSQSYQTLNLPVLIGPHDVILDTLSPAPLKPGERDPGVQP